MNAQTKTRGDSSLLNLSVRCGWVINTTSQPLYPWERYSLHRKFGGPQGWPGQVQKTLFPQGFNPSTVQVKYLTIHGVLFGLVLKIKMKIQKF
jgi:hypothetical protein